jgi:hypothetical protein
MRRARGPLGAVAWLILSCGGSDSPSFDPCVASDTVTLVEPREESRSGFSLLADDHGYAAFFSGPAIEGMPERGPVFATRAGSSPRLLNPGANAQALAAARVAGGFLVCWDSQASSAGEPRRSGCLLVDERLAVVRDWRPSFGTVASFSRVGSQLYALSWPDTDPAPIEWRALDENGEPQGAAMAPPCPEWAGWGDRRMAASALGVACLIPSDPQCGRQFDEPPDCTYGLELHTPDGRLLFSVAAIAPFGVYGSTILANVAARDDGLLVGWTDRESIWHGIPVAPNGSLGPQVDVPGAMVEHLHAVGGGYLATWGGGVDAPRLYRWPMMMLLSPLGEVSRPPAEVAPQRDDLPFQYGPVAVGTSGDGIAVLWEGAEDTAFYPSALLFRSLGCLP